MIKRQGVGCQIEEEKNIFFDISCICSVYIYLRSKTDTTITLGLYDREHGGIAEEKTVDLLKDELNATVLKFEAKNGSQYSIYIKGEDLNIELDKKTRFEVVSIKTWKNPKDIEGDKVTPWKQGQKIMIYQEIEKYRFVHITAKKGVLYINKMISPLYMDQVDTWNINVEDKLTLAFTGTNHKTLFIKETHGFEVVNMVGIEC